MDAEPVHDVYSFTFIPGDTIEYPLEHGHEYDAVHTSPPCQGQIAITAGNRKRSGWTDTYVNLVSPVRAALAAVRARRPIPTVIECGVGKHLCRDVRLCGEMFALAVTRHRWFEIDGATVPEPPHPPHVATCADGVTASIATPVFRRVRRGRRQGHRRPVAAGHGHRLD